MELKLNSEKGTAGLTIGLFKEKLFELFNGFCGSAKVYLTEGEFQRRIIELYDRYSGISSATDEQILAQIKREKENQYKFLPVTDPLNAINNYMG